MKPQMLQESPNRVVEPVETPQEEVIEAEQTGDPDATGSDYRVLLYNDDFHDEEEIVLQLVKATGYQVEQCIQITLEAHTKGRAICYRGSREDCHRVTRVLREIRIQCEVGCD